MPCSLRRKQRLCLVAFAVLTCLVLDALPLGFGLPLDGYRGDAPSEAGHGNQFVISIGKELWYCGDDLMTAASFMADELWALRGENPAQLGSVGVSLRCMGDSLLAGDYVDAAGHLEVTAYSGEHYFAGADFLSLAPVLPADDWEAEAWAAAEAAPKAEEACAGLENVAEVLRDVAGTVGGGVAALSLERAAENLCRITIWLRGGSPDDDKLLASATSELPAEVMKELAQAETDSARVALLRKLALKYHPDQNGGREDEVLPIFLKLQDLRNKAENS